MDEWEWLTRTRNRTFRISLLISLPLTQAITLSLHLPGWAAGLQGFVISAAVYHVTLWWMRKDGPP